MKRLLEALALVSLVALVGATPSSAQYPEGPLNHPREKAIEEAYQAGKATGDLSRVKEELRKVFADPDMDVKQAGLTWIGRHLHELSGMQVDALENLYVEINHGDTTADGVRSGQARRHLEKASLEDRQQAYWRAVKEGSVTLEGAFTLSRLDALAWAALDGLEEFRPLVEKYATDLDASEHQREYRASSFYLWTLDLRKGARDREEGMRLQAQRLEAMDDAKFFELMQNDAAFHEATMYVFRPSCKDERRTSEACKNFALIAARQRELFKSTHEAQVQAMGTGRSPVPVEPPGWLRTLGDQTNAAWVKLVQENTKKVQLQNKEP